MTKNTVTIKDVKEFIRAKYAWPGGYELVAITADGALLCADCAKENFRSIVDDMRSGHNTGWKIVGIAHEAVSADCCDDELKSYCDNCNKSMANCAN